MSCVRSPGAARIKVQDDFAFPIDPYVLSRFAVIE